MPYANADTNREYQREHKRLTRAGDCRTPCTTRLPGEFRLRTARDVLVLLEQQVEAVRSDPKASILEKARTVGYLAGISLRAIESGDVAARLEAVESVLKQRRENLA
ncbi:MAG: hypothetical protein HZA46_07530 [Planctomycetales bacterium]|nr:hypothetical protein [Planctomycetales bacterium]